MKKKSFNKKLNFNKETVSKLNNLKMNDIKGGEPEKTYDCLVELEPIENPVIETRGYVFSCIWPSCI